ncbi:hypothetical protein ATEG_06567 [Aspergillus terreus NIH2624]|uniref:Transcription factor RfeG n=1 Tax=Aspergillus terreus (strain NIH 2624 / FGSC A1156) TaxID=341663 RepID=Q0CIB7_ASPTN|nr:uncharacterized protein ATEG_06567 [Aspergillus terreus NIH2624]EAU33111.1 hypothetical protein ATEG_06567 [Aspergillus terreus NIH2624]
MTGYARPERQNEYFIPGDGISREVIQADICRYLGNDALGRQGYFIRAYRNLTSEMIADLKADSARWEQDVLHRANQGYPRGSYIHDYSMSHAPNRPPASYASSSIHEGRQQGGPSPPPVYSAPPSQTYGVDPYAQSGYSQTQSPPYPNPSSYPPNPSNHSPFAGQNPYPAAQVPYTGASQPPVTADMHPTYTYASTPGYGYEGRSNAPRYAGYDPESDYSPVTSGIAYPPTTAPDPRIGMDTRYTPESAYSDRGRPQPTRERGDAPRRPR